MVRPGRPPAITREQLSAVAVGLFESRGFTGTTVADIAVEAGIAQRTFFLYFSSKAEAFWFDSERAFADAEARLAQIGVVSDSLDVVIDIAASGDVWLSRDRARTRARYELVDATVELQAASLAYHRRWVEAVEVFLRINGVGEADEWMPATIAATMLAVGNTVTREWAFAIREDPLPPRLRRYLRGAVDGLVRS